MCRSPRHLPVLPDTHPSPGLAVLRKREGTALQAPVFRLSDLDVPAVAAVPPMVGEDQPFILPCLLRERSVLQFPKRELAVITHFKELARDDLHSINPIFRDDDDDPRARTERLDFALVRLCHRIDYHGGIHDHSRKWHQITSA